MLEQDPVDAELAALRERAAPLEAQAEELRGQVAKDQVEIDAALGEAVGRPGDRGGAAPDRALRPLRDAAGSPEGHRGGAPGRQPLRRLPSRALLGGGREDPRPSSRRGRHLRAVRPHPRPRLSGSAPAVLILVRHGESVANAQGLLLGRTDAELTETGRAQALAARALLDGPVAEVRSSPLRRARDTAALLGVGPAHRRRRAVDRGRLRRVRGPAPGRHPGRGVAALAARPRFPSRGRRDPGRGGPAHRRRLRGAVRRRRRRCPARRRRRGRGEPREPDQGGGGLGARDRRTCTGASTCAPPR